MYKKFFVRIIFHILPYLVYLLIYHTTNYGFYKTLLRFTNALELLLNEMSIYLMKKSLNVDRRSKVSFAAILEALVCGIKTPDPLTRAVYIV